jgi:hypothetical protein
VEAGLGGMRREEKEGEGERVDSKERREGREV